MSKEHKSEGKQIGNTQKSQSRIANSSLHQGFISKPYNICSRFLCGALRYQIVTTSEMFKWVRPACSQSINRRHSLRAIPSVVMPTTVSAPHCRQVDRNVNQIWSCNVGSPPKINPKTTLADCRRRCCPPNFFAIPLLKNYHEASSTAANNKGNCCQIKQ